MLGTTIAHYKVTAKLGQGGMGEVYRATDSKLDREVAIKVLSESFSKDQRRLARFERAAKSLAALNHPHIAGIYGMEKSADIQALVLELVEGDDLSQRLRKGPLGIDETLEVCKQIAEALEAAHEKGVIHRDLKPSNIKLSVQGKVKVLDFGLAKMQETDSSITDSDCVTITADTTGPGVVMGTPAYMSPEQARGQQMDRRTDVWAFGCVLYECLTGEKPFQGGTATDLVAAVLRSEPDWSRLPYAMPKEIQTLLRRCLEKDPRRRLASLRDIGITLEEVSETRRLNTVVHEVRRGSERANSQGRSSAGWWKALATFGLAATLILTIASLQKVAPVPAC